MINFGKFSLWLVAALIGFALGATYALIAVLADELFGPKSIALKYAIFQSSSVLGTLLCSRLIVGNLYDLEAGRANRTCLGMHCFRSSFNIISGCGLFAVIASFVLARRSEKTYSILSHCSGATVRTSLRQENDQDTERPRRQS